MKGSPLQNNSLSLRFGPFNLSNSRRKISVAALRPRRVAFKWLLPFTFRDPRMFAEDLQGDIYDGSPGVSILLSSPHPIFTLTSPHRNAPFALGAQPRPLRGRNTGFSHPAYSKRRKGNIYAATPSIGGDINWVCLTGRKIKMKSENRGGNCAAAAGPSPVAL